MYTSVKGSALGMTLPKEPIPGKLRISRHHEKFVYTELEGLEETFDDVTQQLNKINPEFNWRVPGNVHGPHSSSNLTGEKIALDLSQVPENTRMQFKVSGCSFRVSQTLGLYQHQTFFTFILLIWI